MGYKYVAFEQASIYCTQSDCKQTFQPFSLVLNLYRLKKGRKYQV